MRVAASPYELTAFATPGRSAGAVRRGALLRFAFPEWGDGYADCHPWPEFGDAPLDDQLRRLGRGEFTRLTERSYGQARVDAQARHASLSAFHDYDAARGIRSHALAGNAADLQPEHIDRLHADGFTFVKIKAGRDAAREAPRLADLARAAGDRRMKLRVDLNASASAADAALLLDSLSAHASAVDFIEDPVAFDEAEWSALRARYPFRLALDLAVRSVPHPVPECVDVLVLKPAVDDAEAIVHRTNRPGLGFVVTSYLDHPIGITGAAWHAFRVEQLSAGRLEACGLMTHMNYAPNPFSRGCRRQGDRWLPPTGSGMGFEEELRACTWSELA